MSGAMKKYDPIKVDWMLIIFDRDLSNDQGDTIQYIPMSVIDSLAQSWYESGVSDVGPGWDDISERFRNTLRDQAHKFIRNFANRNKAEREADKEKKNDGSRTD